MLKMLWREWVWFDPVSNIFVKGELKFVSDLQPTIILRSPLLAQIVF